MKHPDPKKHLQLSIVKSAIRIIGAVALMALGNIWLTVAGACLLVAEVVGIAEELV